MTGLKRGMDPDNEQVGNSRVPHIGEGSTRVPHVGEVGSTRVPHIKEVDSSRGHEDGGEGETKMVPNNGGEGSARRISKRRKVSAVKEKLCI